MTRTPWRVLLILVAGVAGSRVSAAPRPRAAPTLGWRSCLGADGAMLGVAASTSLVAVSAGGEGLVFLDAATGQRTATPVAATGTFDLSFTPDGRTLWAVQRPPGEVALALVRFDMATGARTLLAVTGQDTAFIAWNRDMILTRVGSGYRVLRGADGTTVAEAPRMRETGTLVDTPDGAVVLGLLEAGRRTLSWLGGDLEERARTSVLADGWTSLLAAPSADEVLLAEPDGTLDAVDRTGRRRPMGRLPAGDRPFAFRRADGSVALLTAPGVEPVGACAAVLLAAQAGEPQSSPPLPICEGFAHASAAPDGSAIYAAVSSGGGADHCVQRFWLPAPER